jgi:predicted unusual protein kinase regulating ubiquinone biosynthesis (AarF/ABC1/UbiB family)
MTEAHEATPAVRAVDGPAFYFRPPTRADLARRSAQLAAATPNAFPALARMASRRQVAGSDLGAAIFAVAQRLGGTWVKFGQLLASAPDLVGEDLSEPLRPLLDSVAPVPPLRVRAAVARALGASAEDLFAELDPEPVGTGSLAVVHRGVIRDGREVAVKVLRPGIERDSAADLVMIEGLLGSLTSRRGLGRGPARVMLAQLRRQLGQELDLRREATCMTRFRTLFRRAGLDLLVVPEVVPEMTARRALTMEFLDGVAVDDLAAIETLGFDPAPLVAEAVKGWWTTVGVEGVFHGDVHAGNLLLTRDGRLAIIDWGIVGRLDESDRRLMRLLMEAAAGREEAWAEAAQAVLDALPDRVRMRDGFEDDQARALIRRGLTYALTRPYGEVSLGAILSGEAFGPDRPSRRTGSERTHRAGVKVARGSGQDAGFQGNPDIVLLGKQLLYFERYGKRYLSGRSVLGDAAEVLALVSSSGG